MVSLDQQFFSEQRERRRERNISDVYDRGAVEDGTHLRRTSGMVYIYGLGLEKSVVLVLGLFIKKKYLMCRST